MISGTKRMHDEASSEGYDTEEEMVKDLGYGKSLFKNDEDEKFINSLKALERENILNERHQKMTQYKEKMQLIREYKKANAGSGAPADDQKQALSDLKAQRQRRLQKKWSGSERSADSGSDVGKDSEDSYSSGEEQSMDMDSEQNDRKRGINFVDLEKIRVSRSDLERWCNELFFEETIKGAFLKVNLGQEGQGGGSYRICEVVGVKKCDPYTFGEKKIEKELLVRYGTAERVFKMFVVSNQKFLATEFSQWRSHCEKQKVPIPTQDTIFEIESKLKKARNHSYSPNEINKIIEQNIQQLIEKGKMDMNITYIRTQLETQFKLAKSVYEQDPESFEAREMYQKLKQNLDKLDQLQRKKAETKTTDGEVKGYLAKAQKQEIEESLRRSEMIKKKQKQNTGFDPFSTLPCAPRILWNTHNENEKEQTPKMGKKMSELEMKLAQEQKNEANEGQKVKTDYRTDFEKAVEQKDKIILGIQSAQDRGEVADPSKKRDLKAQTKSAEKFVELMKSVTLPLGDLDKFPTLNKMPKLTQLNPILAEKLAQKQKEREQNDNRKVYTLDEYWQTHMAGAN